VTYQKHGCNKRFCDKFKQKKELCHLLYTRPLKDALPPRVISYSTYSTIFNILKIIGTERLRSYTYIISSACNSSVRDAM